MVVSRSSDQQDPGGLSSRGRRTCRGERIRCDPNDQEVPRTTRQIAVPPAQLDSEGRMVRCRNKVRTLPGRIDQDERLCAGRVMTESSLRVNIDKKYHNWGH